MPCDRYNGPDGSFAYVCSRGRQAAHRCESPGCTRPSVAQCDYPVTREGKPGTCDRHVCARHARRQPGTQEIAAFGMTKTDTIDFCEPHDRVARAKEVAT